MLTLRHNADERIYIVYPLAITSYDFEQAEVIHERIAALTGFSPMLSHGADVPSGASVIYVGRNTECVPAQETLNETNFGEGKIRFLENAVVLATHNDNMLLPLTDYFLSHLHLCEGGIAIDGEADGYTAKDSRYLHRLPLCRGGEVVACRKSHDSSDQLILAHTTAEIFEQYLDELVKKGFTMQWRREMAGNLFACFDDGVAAVHVYFTPFNQYMRIIAEPIAYLYVQDKAPTEEVCQPLMTVIGRRFGNENSRYMGRDAGAGLMSYCLRLCDGSFVLIDGGLETDAFADAFWDAMREQAPDPENIRVRAWIITHSHIDHLGGFLKFTAKYAGKIRLDSFVYNYTSIQDAEKSREAWNIRRTKEALYHNWPDTKVIKIHTGDVMNIGGAKIEFLFTQEDFVRQYFSTLYDEYNCTSLFFRVYLGGNSIMFPGDACESICALMCPMYGNYLKSDILQVCHHGGRGGTPEVYALIDPETAIFSTSDSLFPVYLGLVCNYSLVYRQNVKEVLNSSEKTQVIPLPHHPTECNIPPFEGGIYRHTKWMEVLADMESWKGLEGVEIRKTL